MKWRFDDDEVREADDEIEAAHSSAVSTLA